MDCKRCRLIRWGRHRNGTPRWRCTRCGKTRIRQYQSFPWRLLERFLLDGDTCDQLAFRYRLHQHTIRRRIHRLLEQPPSLPDPLVSGADPCWLVTDATHFKRWGCLLVTKATNSHHPLAVSFHQRECFESALSHLGTLENMAVEGYTTDGRRGLVLAYHQLFPNAASQRCLVHIRMRTQALLTSRPRLPAGQELLFLAQQLVRIKTVTESQKWWQQFAAWQEKWQPVLNERTFKESSPIVSTGAKRPKRSWWYTHRNLRGAWKHILHAADQLFVFLEHPIAVSHTNHLEGLFGQRKPALARHRGLSRRRIAAALLWTFYLLRKR